jgi:integrase
MMSEPDFDLNLSVVSSAALPQATRRPPKLKLGRKAIEEALAARPLGKRLRIYFEGHPGLILNVTRAGAAAWYLSFRQADGTPSEIAIAKEAAITPAMAAEKARLLIAQMTLSGVTPIQAKRAAIATAKTAKAQTLRAVAALWGDAREVKQRAPRTIETRNWQLKKYILPKLGDTPVAEISRQDVRALCRDVQSACKPTKGIGEKAGYRTANAVKALLGLVLNWAVDEGILQSSPVSGMRRLFDDTPNKRVNKCNEDALRHVWNYLLTSKRGKATALAIRLCIVTGQRPNEVTKCHRDDVDFEKLIWSPREQLTKTRTRYFVPLTPYSADLLRAAFRLSAGSEWAFPADSGAPMTARVTATYWKRMRSCLIRQRKLRSDDLTLYDCSRRFVRTWLEEVRRYSETYCEAFINHAPDRSMKRRYNVADMLPRLRKMHVAWQNELLRIAGREQSLQVWSEGVQQEAAE